MKKLSLISFISLWMTACATQDGYIHPSGAPVISYSQSQVVVVFKYDEQTPNRNQRTYYLNSSIHGRRIASAIAVPNNNNRNNNNSARFDPNVNIFSPQQSQGYKPPAWYKPPHSARFNLPTHVPPHTDNVCFYITDAQGKVVPARVRPSYATGSLYAPASNEHGFINPVWQETYALPAQKQGLSNAIKQTQTDLAILKQKIADATRYVNRGEIINNNQCFVPPHSQPEPRPPFSQEYLAQQAVIPMALCLQGDQARPGVPAKIQLIRQSPALAGSSLEALYQSMRFVSQNLDQGQSSIAFPTLVQSTFANKQYKDSCAGSDCRYVRKLYEDNPYRVYADNFNRCVDKVAREIRRTQSGFQQQHRQWQNEPQQRYENCQVQLALFNNKELKLSNLQTQKQVLESRLARLQAVKPRAVKAFQRYEEAYKTPCSI